MEVNVTIPHFFNIIAFKVLIVYNRAFKQPLINVKLT